MSYDTFSDRRYWFSLENLENLKSKKLKFNHEFLKDVIHEYYHPILLTLISQIPSNLDKVITEKGNSFSSPIKNLNEKQLDKLNQLSVELLIKIVSKLLQSSYFKNELKNLMNELLKFLKTLIYFTDNIKCMHQDIHSCDDNFYFQSAGLNPNILLKLLSVKIDKKLVENSKWHVFKLLKF